MKEFYLCGMGHAIVDLIVEVSEAEFAQLGFERGTMRLVEAEEQQQLLAQFAAADPRLVSGGSVGNSTIAFAQLGGKAAFLSCIGDDRYGLHYEREFEQLQIEMGNPVIVNQPTGTCVAVITPDAERTMRTCLGVSSHLSKSHVARDRDLIAKSAWLFIEGYIFANQPHGPEAVAEAVAIAKDNGCKVAVTCSDAFIVHVFGKHLHETLAKADLFFCNASEAMAVANAADAEAAFAKLKDIVPERGVHSLARARSSRARVPVYAEGSDRRRRHVRWGVPLRGYARAIGPRGGSGRELPGRKSHHPDRRSAAPRGEGILATSRQERVTLRMGLGMASF
jgi:sugar/nucleoside kinase (ribokinase family)